MAGSKVAKKEVPVGDKVFDFLQRIRGLNSLKPEDLEQLLFERRFELLGSLNNGDAAGEIDEKRRLPEYCAIPNQRELHDALLGGSIACGYQCVAHVLYPEHVPWPVLEGSDAPVEASTPAAEDPATPVAHPSQTAEATPASASQQEAGEPASPTAADGEAETPVRRNERLGTRDLGASASRSPAEGEVEAADSSGAGRHALMAGNASRNQNREGNSSSHFTLCGQKVSNTVRGKQVQEQNEDLLAMYMKAADDERYNAARDERLRLERAVKLEQYHEKTLQEKISNLEFARQSELVHQADIRKRESGRKARKEVLKKDLEVAWVGKLAKEKEEEEAEKQRKEKQAEMERKEKRYHEKQKLVVQEWYEKKLSASQGDNEELVSQEAQRLAKEKERLKNQRPKTVKQVQAEDKVTRMQVATEQRPPLPPRAHDLPRPVMDLMDDSAIRPAPQAKPLGSWTREAKVVADTYGLTPREHSAVEGRFTRGIQGAGRMSQYEK